MEAITVTKLNTYIKQIFDAEELLHNIPVVGEIFGISSSRNVFYFSLKDESSSLSCVSFYPNLFIDIKEGDKVIVTGSPNYYIKGGRLNFNVIKLEKVGLGELYEQFLKLKDKLQHEGLFDEHHKKKIPSEIKRIGVITSKEGAVIQDIKNVAWRRNPMVDIVLYNTKVQGLNAENEIAHAIEVMGKYDKIDVIVVARGGGSLEDLWAYNTEVVARATYNCTKPIVSAVGHETDYTIIDFVSDLRAPTPSAAAELLTFDLSGKRAEMWGMFELLYSEVKKIINKNINAFNMINYKLFNVIEKRLVKEENNFNNKKYDFLNSCESFINQQYYDLGLIETTIKNIDPKKILSQGYAKIEQNNISVLSLAQLNKDNDLTINFIDGKIKARPIKGE